MALTSTLIRILLGNSGPMKTSYAIKIAILSLAGAFSLHSNAQPSSQAYPSKKITLIIPFASGGTTHIIAAAIAPKLSKELGQEIEIINKAGRGGLLGTLELVKSKADGYTLAMASASTTATNPAINGDSEYDPRLDLTPIINIAATPNIIVVHGSFPARDYERFVQTLRENPGKFSYASTGAGGIAHLQMEIFKTHTGTMVQHVPFRGAGPAWNEVVSGQIPIMLDNSPSMLPLLKYGRLFPIVVSAPKRLKELPHTPTFSEVGIPDANRMAYYGLVGPKNLPPEVVKRINLAVKKVLTDPSVKAEIEGFGATILSSTPSQFSEKISSEFLTYKTLVEKNKLTINSTKQ